MSAPSTYSLPLQLRVVPRIFFGSILGTLAFLVLFLLLRRLSGALNTPLEFLPALFAGLLLGCGSWLLRRCVRSERSITAITVATWLVVVVLTLSNRDLLSILALWLPVITAEAVWRVLPHEQTGPAAAVASVRQAAVVHAPVETASPANVVQQFTRTREDDVEVISGSATLNFEAGEQTATLHLVFSPSLNSDPEIEVESETEGVSVRTTERRSYGARIEAKRRDSREEQSISIHFEAVG